MLGSNGSLKNRTDGLNKTITDLGNQKARAKAASDAELSVMRTRFIALDKMVAQMNSTGAYLSQQFAAMNKSK